MFAKNGSMAGVFLPEEHIADANEREFVLQSLAENLTGFFETLFKRNLYTKADAFAKICEETGERHRAYGRREKFKVRCMYSFAEIGVGGVVYNDG